MGKSADDTAWLEDLAGARDQEPNDDSPHPADLEADLTPDPGLTDQESTQAQAPDPQPNDDAPADAGEKQTVPLAVMLEERTQLNAKIAHLEQTNQATAAQLAKLQGLENEIRAMREAQAKPPEPEPDYLEDPKGYVDHTKKSVAQELAELGNQVKQLGEVQETSKTQTEQQQQIMQITQAAAADEATFAKATPDYNDALAHLRDVRGQQLKLAYPEATPLQIQQQINREEFASAAMVLGQGRSPAEYAYNLAKSFGYTPAKPGDQGDEDPNDLAERRRAARGMGGSGAPPGDDLGALMSADKDEFDQAMKEMFG